MTARPPQTTRDFTKDLTRAQRIERLLRSTDLTEQQAARIVDQNIAKENA